MSHDRTTRTPPAATGAGDLVLGIVVGSTRPNRRAQAVADWTHREVASHLAAVDPGVEVSLLDLATFDLPLLDEPEPPALGRYRHAHTEAWSAAVDPCDGFVFVTPEYNHSTSAALKNAIDFLHREWHDKAAGMVGYGVAGGVRAVEHLRQILAEVHVADVRTALALSVFDDFDGTACAPRDHHRDQLQRMVDELLTWSRALRPVRATPAGR